MAIGLGSLRRALGLPLLAVGLALVCLSRIHLPALLCSTPVTTLPSSYEGSDFPPTVIRRGGGSPVHYTRTSYRSVSNHTHDSLGRFLFTLFPSAPGLSLRAVSRLHPPGLRASDKPRSLASHKCRIEFLSYGPVVHLQLLSTPPYGDAVTFGCQPVSGWLEGTLTLLFKCAPERTGSDVLVR